MRFTCTVTSCFCLFIVYVSLMNSRVKLWSTKRIVCFTGIHRKVLLYFLSAGVLPEYFPANVNLLLWGIQKNKRTAGAAGVTTLQQRGIKYDCEDLETVPGVWWQSYIFVVGNLHTRQPKPWTGVWGGGLVESACDGLRNGDLLLFLYNFVKEEDPQIKGLKH